MKKISLAFCLLFFTGAASVLAEEYKFVNLGWSAEEAVLSKALAISARELEKKSDFRFDQTWELKVSLERLGLRGMAQYQPETKIISFSSSIMSEMRINHKLPLYELDPAVVAGDDLWGPIIDHELGHLLMDQVSRQAGQGPWFTLEHFYSLTREEQLGLNILSEGVGTYFGQINYPRRENYAELAFPATPEEQRIYPYDIIVNYGGYWLVSDILSKYGQRGLIWIVQHPFVAREDMRQAAVEYRKRALSELAR